MKPKDIFGLMIRFIGLIFLFEGLRAVPLAWANLCQVWPQHHAMGAQSQFQFRVIFGILLSFGWPLAIGIWLVRGAPWLVRFAYRREERQAAELAARQSTLPDR